MENNTIVENITPQSSLQQQAESEFLTPEEFLQLAWAKLEYLKALYRKRLGYELAVEALLA